MRKRIARALIKLAHKVYPPKVTHFPQNWSGLGHTTPGAGSAAQAGLDIANRAIRNARYAGQGAGMAVDGLLESIDTPKVEPPRRITDWFGRGIR